MTFRERLRDRRPEFLLLWGAAIGAVGLALLDVPLLGLEPGTLAAIGAVLAALTTLYHRVSGSEPE